MIHVSKGWGYELWITNTPKYCGKILHFNEGKKCSFHYHKLKDETFYLQSGKLILRYSNDDEFQHEIVLMPGASFHVPIAMRHQMEALVASDLFEFSTEHFDDDSYRIERGD